MVVSWLSWKSNRDSNFIFGPKSLNLINLHRDLEGRTAIHVAAIKGQANNVLKMLSFGCSLEDTDAAGRTPRALAEKEGQLKVIEAIETYQRWLQREQAAEAGP